MYTPVIIESRYAPQGVVKPAMTKAQFDDCYCNTDDDLGDLCDLCDDYLDWEEALEVNLRYARAAMKDSLKRGEAPFASHLLYTQEGVLDDTKPDERNWGIQAGFAWRALAKKTVVYVDLGISYGMELGIKHAVDTGCEVEYRHLGTNWEELLK